MEWLKKLIAAAKITDGKLDADALCAGIEKEIPKHMVDLETHNTVKGDLDAAQKRVKALEKLDAEGLQAQLGQERSARAKEQREYQFKSFALQSGALDPDYLLFKRGLLDGDFDEAGKLQNTDDILQSLREGFPTQFKTEKQDEQAAPYSYEPKGGKGKEDSAGAASFVDIIRAEQAGKND